MKKLIATFIFLSFLLVQPAFASTNWSKYSPGNSSLQDRDITAIAVAPDDTVWIGTDGHGVNSFNGTTFTAYSNTRTSVINDIVCYGNDVYCATDNGLYHFNGTGWVRWTTGTTSLPSNEVTSLDFQGTDTLWIGTDSGLAKCVNPNQSGKTWTVYRASSSGLPNDEIDGVAYNPSDGSVWVATYSGVGKLSGSSWYKITKTDGLLLTEATDIDVGSDGAVWVTHENDYDYVNHREVIIPGGISKYNGSSWTKYSYSTCGSSKQGIKRVFVDNSNNPWFLSYNDLLIYFNGTTWKKFSCGTASLTPSTYTSVAFDGNDNVWLGTMEGIFKYGTLDYSLTSSVNDQTLTYGQPARVNSYLKDSGIPVNGSRVYLRYANLPQISYWDYYYYDEEEYYYDGEDDYNFYRFDTVLGANTNSNGLASFSFKPLKSGYVRTYKKLSNGALVSRSLMIKVKPQLSFHSNTSKIRLGQTFKFYGTIKPSHPKQIIALQVYSNKKWRNTTGAIFNKYSKYLMSWKPKKRATYKLRVFFYSDHDHENAYVTKTVRVI